MEGIYMQGNIEFMQGGITAPEGFLASGVHCGIRKNKAKLDVALIMADRMCAAAAVYTVNKVKAAPILLTMENLKDGKARAVLVNSGCANACAPGGMEAAKATIDAAATATGLQPADFIVASTGVIGVALPADKIIGSLPQLVQELSTDGTNATEAIMTTDTFMKATAVSFTLGGKIVKIGGITKGSGMIHPNMATMLTFLTTDCDISTELLQEALKTSTNRTYNRISVDGDTSTNDMAAILANGAAGNAKITEKNADYEIFQAALDAVNLKLAKDIAIDGEGATKLIICNVTGAASEEVAVLAGKSVISSSLVKAALFGEDANWGRILCACGYSGADFDPNKVDIAFSSAKGCIDVCENGAGLSFDEEIAKHVLSERDITIEINLNNGSYSAETYGCDLTYDYVKINGDYRS